MYISENFVLYIFQAIKTALSEQSISGSGREVTGSGGMQPSKALSLRSSDGALRGRVGDSLLFDHLSKEVHAQERGPLVVAEVRLDTQVLAHRRHCLAVQLASDVRRSVRDEHLSAEVLSGVQCAEQLVTLETTEEVGGPLRRLPDEVLNVRR